MATTLASRSYRVMATHRRDNSIMMQLTVFGSLPLEQKNVNLHQVTPQTRLLRQNIELQEENQPNLGNQETTENQEEAQQQQDAEVNRAERWCPPKVEPAGVVNIIESIKMLHFHAHQVMENDNTLDLFFNVKFPQGWESFDQDDLREEYDLLFNYMINRCGAVIPHPTRRVLGEIFTPLPYPRYIEYVRKVLEFIYLITPHGTDTMTEVVGLLPDNWSHQCEEQLWLLVNQLVQVLITSADVSIVFATV